MSFQNVPANLTPSLGWLFASPIGRLGREPYWLGMIFSWLVIGVAISMWLNTLDTSVPVEELNIAAFVQSNPLFPILFIVLQWIELALVMKRCQDAGLPGFAGMMVLVPIANVLFVAVMGFVPSQQRPNRYGPMPNSYYRKPAA
ncbi:DUF805 domain-containing protein [Roseibium suaedae]|uniref:Uncharacterized membrane protein YhaH, DUF805 family n=1 Tax=Roseibium suaedae TaxID=735517 RepID=A0A1M7A4F4_9HYPH|nr:DUF805 domain-containing protein [Roseibium suaedae]SHL37632.1 Uncharacterized membrane protein YhaH, DUF805 family [Roseibium suaedae]